ncbi:hypothetical protein [Vulgatibacter incomptus]|uniref:Lipoprotein n=1 Tax=Vulgatibacter incomptus TaxID=1391653 RepID=A0A0K1PBM9_9BACT|nr:hypothetical protein [Vulgatibacter incomptus]AKU90943.1 hypothetical protein AKJ08_1330 [Vulgatibacter incomptus]
MYRNHVLSFFLAGALAGCAGEKGPAGPAGPAGEAAESCTVSSVDGVAVITCPDGTSTTVTCSVESNGDGTHTITCPGGGSVVVRDGEELPRGTLTGTATRYGLPAISGIKAEVLELDRSALTDDTGRFFLDDIRPGVYRIRFTYPGYAPLELGNVLVFGNQVDVGESVLKVGRLIATGDIRWDVSPDESKVAVIREHERGALWVVELAGGEARMVAPDAYNPYFLDDRFLGYHAGSDGWDVVVYDLEEDSSTVVGSNENSLSVPGGLVLEGESGNRFVRLPGFEIIELPGAGLNYVSRDSRYFGLTRDHRYPLGIFDTVSGAVFQIEEPAFSHFGMNPSRGRMGYFHMIDLGLWFMVLDPATGHSTPIEWVPGPDMVSWSDDGNLVGFRGEDGIRIHDFEHGTTTDLGISEGRNLSFSPTGRFVIAPNNSGRNIVDRETGAIWPAGDAWVWTFSESERWAFSNWFWKAEVLDTTDGSLHTVESAFDQFFPLPDEQGFFATASGKAFFYDPVTEELTDLGEGENWVPNADRSQVLFTDPLTGHLSVLDLGTRTTSDLGVQGTANARAGDHFLVITDMDRGAFGLVGMDGAWLPIDEQPQDLELFRTGFLYQTGDPSRPSDPAELRLFWVPYP